MSAPLPLGLRAQIRLDSLPEDAQKPFRPFSKSCGGVKPEALAVEFTPNVTAHNAQTTKTALNRDALSGKRQPVSPQYLLMCVVLVVITEKRLMPPQGTGRAHADAPREEADRPRLTAERLQAEPS